VYVTHFHSLVFTLSGRTVHEVGEMSRRRSVHHLHGCSRRVQLAFSHGQLLAGWPALAASPDASI